MIFMNTCWDSDCYNVYDAEEDAGISFIRSFVQNGRGNGSPEVQQPIGNMKVFVEG